MKNTFIPPIVFGFFLLLNSTFGIAQQSKQAIVLINSQPCLVELDAKGNIVKVIKQTPDALEGYDLNNLSFETLPQVPQVKIKDPETPPIIFIDKPKAAEDGTVNAIYNYQVSADIDAVTKFNVGEATLSTEARIALDKVVEDLLLNTTDVVVIRSLSINRESKLHINRVDAVKTYLRIKGVNSDRIIAENLQGRIDADEVKVHIIRGFLK